MIQPDSLLTHARRLAASGRRSTVDTDHRRATSAAYYAVFHDMTDRAARHLIGSAPDHERNKIRRAWTHGEIAAVATMAVGRAAMLAANPAAPLPKEAGVGGPLIDLTSSDPDLVEALQLLVDLKAQRQRADYDHDARFDGEVASSACDDASRARDLLAQASPASREAFLSLLTVRRPDFRER